METTFKILTILGSPHDKNSNTKALVTDFVEDVVNAGLQLENEIISLGKKQVLPCKGCWNCTYKHPCPINDDLEEIKIKMIECDMLILASPVYANQVTAQMKAFFDRLYTWCHIYPILGKYSLSAVTTGNDGHKPTDKFLEKMLATYGTFSFGTVYSILAFTPGFFPGREIARAKNKKLAAKAAKTILIGKLPARKSIQRKIFFTMKNKMNGVLVLNSIRNGNVEGQPNPFWLRINILNFFFKKLKLSEKEIEKWAGFLPFELVER